MGKMWCVVFRFQLFVWYKNRLTNRLLVLITFHFKLRSIDIHQLDEFIFPPPQDTDAMYTLRRKLCRKDILAGTTKTDLFQLINLKSTRWYKKNRGYSPWRVTKVRAGWLMTANNNVTQSVTTGGGRTQNNRIPWELNPKTMDAYLLDKKLILWHTKSISTLRV